MFSGAASAAVPKQLVRGSPEVKVDTEAQGPAGLVVTLVLLVSPVYCTGWVNQKAMVGKNSFLNHDLNSVDVSVELSGRTNVEGSIHQWNLEIGTTYGWSETWGTSSGYGWSVVQTGDGGYAIAGATSSYGAGASDVWLVKADSVGNMLWNKTYGGAGYDSGWSVVQTGDEGYVIGAAGFWLVKMEADAPSIPGGSFLINDNLVYALIVIVVSVLALAVYLVKRKR